MEHYETILEIMSVVFLIVGIIFRKRAWGQKLLFFCLGMLTVFILTDNLPAFIRGFNEGLNEGLKLVKP